MKEISMYVCGMLAILGICASICYIWNLCHTRDIQYVKNGLIQCSSRDGVGVYYRWTTPSECRNQP